MSKSVSTSYPLPQVSFINVKFTALFQSFCLVDSGLGLGEEVVTSLL